MSSIRRKAWYVTPAVALAWTIALASPLVAAPTADNQDNQGAPASMPKDARPMSGNAEDMSGMMHEHGPMSGMSRGGSSDMTQHGGNMDMMQHGGTMDMVQHHQAMMGKMQAMHSGVPNLPGQDAFGAIGEIVALLEADPRTDWTKVDIEALRAHLVDMNEVMLNAAATPKPVDGGIQVSVTGAGRTLAAIQRMVPMHAVEIDGQKGWSAKSSPLPDGVLLTVTATDPKETEHIRGLGFAGIMVAGSHHQAHHLAIAKGEPMHAAGPDPARHPH